MTSIYQTFEEYRVGLQARLREPISICGLAGPWCLFQRSRGHRQSTDDTLTAWYALQKSPAVSAVLDLGSGVGTVGLIVLGGLGEGARLTCVEAQEVSFELLRTNIECNGLADRVTAIHADLRHLHLEQRFPLITASPPYFPAHAGTMPKDSQKAYAKFELRGHLGDYARAAREHLQPGGLFAYCFPFRDKQRGIDLVQGEGFHITHCRDVIPTPSSRPLFSLFTASTEGPALTNEEEPLLIQGKNGRYTEEMLVIQQSRGFGPEGSNTRSFPTRLR